MQKQFRRDLDEDERATMNKKLILGIFLGLLLFGYGMGKWVVGRRGDRTMPAREENKIPNSVPRATAILNSSVAAATDEGLIPVLTQASTELPNPPFLLSWCEGKDCEHRFSMKLGCIADLYTDAKEDSKKVVELKVGTEIETRIYYTKVMKLGSYVPLEASKRILVSRAGKNLWVSFHDNAWDSSEWPADEYEKNPVYQVVYPVTEAWALVKTKSGMSGFLKITESKGKVCPFVKAKR